MFYSFFICHHLILVVDYIFCNFAYMFAVMPCFTFLENKASLPVMSQAQYFMLCRSVSVFCVINFFGQCKTPMHVHLQTQPNLLFIFRYTMERPRFSDHLEAIKFICKDFWSELFKKQIDNLKTNHRVMQKHLLLFSLLVKH
jgi:hypothetical protein